jgi:transposase
LIGKNTRTPMNKTLPTIHESLSELEERLRHERHPKRKERLQLLLFIQNQQARSRKDAARLIGRSRNTIGRWLSDYEHGGLDRLLAIYQPRGQTGQRTLPPQVFEALQAKLDRPEGFGGYLHLQGWLLAEYHLTVHYETLRRLVHRELGATLKVPRPVHEKKAPNEPMPSPTS